MLNFKVPIFKDICGAKKIYFIGICGTAMSSLALMMKEMGYEVYGSDEGVYPPVSEFLREKGIIPFVPYSKENLKVHPDLVVIGNSVGRGNEEIEYVLDNKINFISMAELIGRLAFLSKETIVVSGTHGKTTTSSMMAWLLEYLDSNPSFIIGGIVRNFKSSYKVGGGDLFVLEGDEYDTSFFDKRPKFMHYFPDYLILNPVEFDHADIYQNLDIIIKEFKNLVKIVPTRGFIAYYGDSEICRDIVGESLSDTESFGLSSENDWYPEDIIFKNGKIEYRLFYRKKFIGVINLNMFGYHNVLNSLAAISILNRLGYSFDGIKGGFARFLGVKRRMELIYQKNGVYIYEDFAHHPTAVYETLKGVRESFPNKKIIAIFEPRSWSCRLNVHQGKFVESFKYANVAIFYKVYRGDKIPVEKRFKPDIEVEHLRKSGKESYYFNTLDQILDFLKKEEKNRYVAVIMSNGGFDGLYKKIKEAFNYN